jgi:hypothetical protein
MFLGPKRRNAVGVVETQAAADAVRAAVLERDVLATPRARLNGSGGWHQPAPVVIVLVTHRLNA